MAAFGIVFSRIWHSLVLHARARQQVSDQALVDAASDLWSAHDTFAEEMAASHRETTMALVLRNEGERSALVGALLEGRPLHETSVWDVADVLRLPNAALSSWSRPKRCNWLRKRCRASRTAAPDRVDHRPLPERPPSHRGDPDRARSRVAGNCAMINDRRKWPRAIATDL
jgi:hypothetical protein